MLAMKDVFVANGLDVSVVCVQSIVLALATSTMCWSKMEKQEWFYMSFFCSKIQSNFFVIVNLKLTVIKTKTGIINEY